MQLADEFRVLGVVGRVPDFGLKDGKLYRWLQVS